MSLKERNAMPKVERTIEPAKYGNGYTVYEWGIYESSSVLAGQTKKQYVDGFDTIEEAQAKYPDAEASDSIQSAGNYFNHLPGPDDWDEETQCYGGIQQKGKQC